MFTVSQSNVIKNLPRISNCWLFSNLHKRKSTRTLEIHCKEKPEKESWKMISLSSRSKCVWLILTQKKIFSVCPWTRKPPKIEMRCVSRAHSKKVSLNSEVNLTRVWCNLVKILEKWKGNFSRKFIRRLLLGLTVKLSEKFLGWK